LVRSVERGGPAEKAGIEIGDIIMRFDGRQIDRASDLPRLVGGTRPGSKVDIQVWRRGQMRDLSITVDELRPEATASAGSSNTPQSPAAPVVNALGLSVTDIPADRLSQLRLKGGVIVQGVEGVAERAGLRAGDIVLALNNTEVTNAAQFNQLVASADRSRTIVLLVQRGGNAQFVPIRPE
jgi:serine protease Do